jgi:hypothetical protein
VTRGRIGGTITAPNPEDCAAVSELSVDSAPRNDEVCPWPNEGPLLDEGANISLPAGRLDEAAARKSPKTGAGVTRRRGSGPRQGLIRGMRDNLSPTGEDDAALVVAPLIFIREEGDMDLDRSADLQNVELTSDDVDLGQTLDALVG